MFELLWYSQLPCFDVVNVTSKANQDFGRLISSCNFNFSHAIYSLSQA